VSRDYDNGGGDVYVHDAPVTLGPMVFKMKFGAKDHHISFINLEGSISVASQSGCLSSTEDMRTKLATLYGPFDGPVQQGFNLDHPETKVTKTGAGRALTIRTIYLTREYCLMMIELYVH